jgi:hypothetical protein
MASTNTYLTSVLDRLLLPPCLRFSLLRFGLGLGLADAIRRSPTSIGVVVVESSSSWSHRSRVGGVVVVVVSLLWWSTRKQLQYSSARYQYHFTRRKYERFRIWLEGYICRGVSLFTSSLPILYLQAHSILDPTTTKPFTPQFHLEHARSDNPANIDHRHHHLESLPSVLHLKTTSVQTNRKSLLLVLEGKLMGSSSSGFSSTFKGICL